MFLKKMRGNTLRWFSIGTGAFIVVIAIGILTFADQKQYLACGPMNTGHEHLNCNDCHRPVDANWTKQIASSASYLLGLQEETTGFGSIKVENQVCLNCHERPNDRHPVGRFLEPRFDHARESLAPQNCSSCHTEHQGIRVTVSSAGFCSTCHQDMQMKDDPLSLSHASLAKLNRWDSCLTCHDYHGNHKGKAPTLFEDAATIDQIKEYLNGGASPYSKEKYFQPNTPRDKQ